jgi:hypothetical protein
MSRTVKKHKSNNAKSGIAKNYHELSYTGNFKECSCCSPWGLKKKERKKVFVRLFRRTVSNRIELED